MSEPTPDDIAEKLTHLVESARRCHGTAWYERRHADIDRALDEWQRVAPTSDEAPPVNATPTRH